MLDKSHGVGVCYRHLQLLALGFSQNANSLKLPLLSVSSYYKVGYRKAIKPLTEFVTRSTIRLAWQPARQPGPPVVHEDIVGRGNLASPSSPDGARHPQAHQERGDPYLDKAPSCRTAPLSRHPPPLVLHPGHHCSKRGARSRLTLRVWLPIDIVGRAIAQLDQQSYLTASANEISGRRQHGRNVSRLAVCARGCAVAGL